MLDKYISSMKNINNFKDFKGIPNFEFPNENTAKIINSISNINKTGKIDIEKMISSQDELDKIINNIIAEYSEQAKKALYKSDKAWIPSKNNLKIMIKFATTNMTKASISNLCKNAVNVVDKIEKASLSLCKKYSKDTEKLNSLYKVVCKLCNLCIKQYNSCKDLQIREIGAMRKAIIICGNHCIKSVKESAEDQYITAVVLSETSDELIKDIFIGGIYNG